MLPGHGDDEVDARGDLGVELTRGKARRIAAEVRQNTRGIGVHGVTDHRPGSGTGRGEVRNLKLGAVGRREPLGGGERQMFPVQTNRTQGRAPQFVFRAGQPRTILPPDGSLDSGLARPNRRL